MSYQENPFKAGDQVVCIKDCPGLVHRSTDPRQIGTTTPVTPRKGDVLEVDEVLGEYLRFDQFDTDNYEWWFHTYFRKATRELQASEQDDAMFHPLVQVDRVDVVRQVDTFTS